LLKIANNKRPPAPANQRKHTMSQINQVPSESLRIHKMKDAGQTASLGWHSISLETSNTDSNGPRSFCDNVIPLVLSGRLHSSWQRRNGDVGGRQPIRLLCQNVFTIIYERTISIFQLVTNITYPNVRLQ
jgi:hypothetical protein